MMQVRHLREQPRGNKHVSFDSDGRHVAVSCSDGIIYIYSLDADEPALVERLEGVVQRLDLDSEASNKAYWHPKMPTFAAPTTAHDMQIVKRSSGDGWEIARDVTFRDGHTGNITAAAWSPTGSILATTGTDKRLVLWDTSNRSIIDTFRDLPAAVMGLCWHPTMNLLSYTTDEGELFIRSDVVPKESEHLLKATSVPSNPGPAPKSTRPGEAAASKTRRQGTPDSLDDLLDDAPAGDDYMMVDDDQMFVIDDDGAGYVDSAPQGRSKRKRSDDDGGHSRPYHSGPSWEPVVHSSFQPGCTPWKNDRRYLCLNLIGAVWSLNQQTHNTVTVEFYDREYHRDFHFTDPFNWDKACLNDAGTLFSCPASAPKKKKKKAKYAEELRELGILDGEDPVDDVEDDDDGSHPAMLYYRPHESWTTRIDWRTSLPRGEDVTSIALSESYVVATTTAGYVRVYSLFGVPIRIYRQKSGPAVSCAAWKDLVITIGNGPVVDDGVGGFSQLLYSIENVKTDEIFQNEDIVAITPGTTLKSVLFSDEGDPFIYDSTGVLLVLLHWRTPGQARWVPILDTKLIAPTITDRTYWPVAVARERFHCILLNGKANRHPYFPRPLLSDFEFQVPISSTVSSSLSGSRSKNDEENTRLEQSFVVNSLSLSILEDRITASTMTTTTKGSGDAVDAATAHAQRVEQTRLAIEADKALLQLLALECRLGDDHGMKALEIVSLFRDTTGRMLDAAEKVAVRFGRNVLADKIRQVAEQRLEEQQGLDMDLDG